MVKLTPNEKRRKDYLIPSVLQINADKVTQLSHKYWASYNVEEHEPFDGKVIDDLYLHELRASRFQTRRIALLEISQYLENYLWPNFDPETSTFAHVMSIVCMINEKCREGVQIWTTFYNDEDKFEKFFYRVLNIILDDENTGFSERFVGVTFLNTAFSSLEVELVRKRVQNLVSLHIWHCLSEGRREREFKRFPKWRKYWKALLKREEKETNEVKKQELKFYQTFFKKLILNFLNIVQEYDYNQEALDREFLSYCEKFLELMIDLQALLPTRRYLNILIDDVHLIVRCQMSPLAKEHIDGQLFSQLLDRLKFYAHFEISNDTGDAMNEVEIMSEHYEKIISLQETIFINLPEMRQFALSNVNCIDTRAALMKNFKLLGLEKLKELAQSLYLINPTDNETVTEEFLLEVLIFQFERRVSQIKRLNAMALYPTEEMIWDENLVPTDYHTSSGQILALPKLNLQFLTLHDYLLRNFELFRLESTYQIRQDIEDSCYRLRPWRAEDGSILFHGWARFAQPIVRFAVVEVAKPNLGESKPYRVRADVSLNLSVKTEVKHEWESLRKHDACFLITVKPKNSDPLRYNIKGDFIKQIGLIHVRGCEIEGMLDGNGRVIEEGPEPRPHLGGDSRTFRVILDSNQYKIDMDSISKGNDDPYESFNILLRRKPKENNFKAVLETIRNLMNINCSVPDWIHDVVLGYGEPSSAHYSNLPNELVELDFNDTFLDLQHVKESFPDYEIKVEENKNCPEKIERPFKIKFLDVEDKKGGKAEDEISKKLIVKPYNIEIRGPYPKDVPNLNKIRFTPTQIEAVKSGLQPGLTLIVGPPGTGKTDVATQIISNIYHNFPQQRTLIVTHSNQALNQLFEKIIALDVDERHLLRLGHGEEQLETEKDFSRYGRVNFVLAKRIDCLNEIEKLQKSLNVVGDVAYTCETAGFFQVNHIIPKWEDFLEKVQSDPSVEQIYKSFPFHNFFQDAPQPIFKQKCFEDDMEMAEGCYRYIKRIFEQIDEFRAFELLRTGLDRSRYLLVKEAKIIAMTCTHAALKRKELIDLAFEYDNILMEEAAQILEIETFIPLLLQNPEQGRTRLKRWIMIGDHHQLPPVIKNMAFQKYGNMEQSLFARFVRLGVPTVELDAQGRSRPSISCLYKWRYKCLGDLPHVEIQPEYRLAVPGFKFDYQLINVSDFNGVGESEPSPYFFQNLAEAEYVTATFMYMRLLGYPADKITILTTYNGQKALIRDVINTRCGKNPLIGQPHKITTVDKYQGQQNDYILLSLVRTKTVGHLRDVRRLIVAMSRARLGLFIFARISLFSNCFELTPAFSILTQKPAKLHLYPVENYPTERLFKDEHPGEVLVMENMPQMATFVYEMYTKKLAVLMEQAEKAKREAPKQEEIKIVAKESLGPIPIEFEETNVLEKPAEIMNMEISEPVGLPEVVDIEPFSKMEEEDYGGE